jgi:hypothetical protein
VRPANTKTNHTPPPRWPGRRSPPRSAATVTLGAPYLAPAIYAPAICAPVASPPAGRAPGWRHPSGPCSGACQCSPPLHDPAAWHVSRAPTSSALPFSAPCHCGQAVERRRRRRATAFAPMPSRLWRRRFSPRRHSQLYHSDARAWWLHPLPPHGQARSVDCKRFSDGSRLQCVCILLLSSIKCSSATKHIVTI